MLRGIERLHSEGFLHCDVKPGNVMIDRLGIIRLVDFGRAVLAGERVTFLLGSPMYMAPETHRRQPGSFEADFFSVGLVGIEMLCGGQVISEDEIDEDRLLEVKMKLAGRLSDILPPHVTRMRSLTRILRRLLEPDPANRYGSAKEVEIGDAGLSAVDKQFMKAGIDAEFGRELSDYLAKLVDDRTGRVELGADDGPSEEGLTMRLSAERTNNAT
jgi:serine/threonine protein kinase